MSSRFLAALWLAATLLAAGCATMPPGLDAPKTESSALARPETTTLGKRFDARAKEHRGLSGFRVLADGAESFDLRMRIAEKAEKTLDVQYFLLKQDDTGQLLLGAVLAAADRGVRVRILLDDALGIDGGAKIRPLSAHPNIEIRVFNPYLTRQEFLFLRGVEYLLQVGRLDYRMHNKLFVGDNAIAVTGGRNIGNEYFQASTELEFGDFDLAVAGPMVRDLLLAEMLSGKRPLVWAKATLAYDSPDKASTRSGEYPGQLMWKRVAVATESVKSDLIIVSPYLVPGASELKLLRELRERGVRVRILTNSLASTDMPIVHAGYGKYRVPLLEMGVELYEVRRKRGEPDTDRGPLEIAREIAARFDAIAQPANSYQVILASSNSSAFPSLKWRGVDKAGNTVTFDSEPGVKAIKRSWIETLSLLPLDGLL